MTRDLISKTTRNEFRELLVGYTLREIEMEVILQTLDKNSGDKPRTALELGIALKTLYNKLNQSQNHAEAD